MIYGSPFIPNFAKGTTALGGAETHFVCQEGCLNWVNNGPDGPEIRLPLFPQKRTQVGHRAMSVSCQQRTSRTGKRRLAIKPFAGQRTTAQLPCRAKTRNRAAG